MKSLPYGESRTYVFGVRSSWEVNTGIWIGKTLTCRFLCNMMLSETRIVVEPLLQYRFDIRLRQYVSQSCI
jgi:hypothetical protein